MLISSPWLRQCFDRYSLRLQLKFAQRKNCGFKIQPMAATVWRSQLVFAAEACAEESVVSISSPWLWQCCDTHSLGLQLKNVQRKECRFNIQPMAATVFWQVQLAFAAEECAVESVVSISSSWLRQGSVLSPCVCSWRIRRGKCCVNIQPICARVFWHTQLAFVAEEGAEEQSDFNIQPMAAIVLWRSKLAFAADGCGKERVPFQYPVHDCDAVAALTACVCSWGMCKGKSAVSESSPWLR